MGRGEGAWLYDVDGNRYIDRMMGYGVLPLGHAHPAVTRAIQEAAATGAYFATATPVEVEVAEMLQRLIPSAGRRVSPRPPSTWPATPLPSSPARCWWWTAAAWPEDRRTEQCVV